MELVVDWNAVCLVCLQEGEMKSIFENDDKDLTIREKIIRCSDIEIQKGMNLPEQICSNCYEDLKIAYKFRTNCESSNVILKSFLNVNFNDVKLQNQNGQAFKCKQSGIGNVRRIKVAPKFEIKEENILSENAETEYVTDTNDNDCVEQDDNDIAETIFETYTNYEDDDDDCDDNNYDNNQEAHEIINESQEEENLEKEKNIRTDNSTNYTSIKKVKEENDDKDMDVVVYKKVFEESEDEMESVQQNEEQLQENEYKTYLLTDNENNSNTEQKPRKRGRPRFNVIKANLEVTPANVSQMVPKLTTVAYVKKKKNGEKPLKMCEICGNGYKYQHALDSHMRRHRNEKPFACEFCDRAFVANVELRRHMRVHTGQKPYSCRYCPRSFSDFGSRIKHERTHTGERPYECSTCGKAFAYAHVLSVHVLTHTGEKKFKCEICGKGFTKKAYLQSHTNQHFGLRKDPIIHEIQILTEGNDTNEEILGNEYELAESIEHKVEEYVGDEVE